MIFDLLTLSALVIVAAITAFLLSSLSPSPRRGGNGCPRKMRTPIVTKSG